MNLSVYVISFSADNAIFAFFVVSLDQEEL